jgi:hypothetical protein
MTTKLHMIAPMKPPTVSAGSRVPALMGKSHHRTNQSEHVSRADVGGGHTRSALTALVCLLARFAAAADFECARAQQEADRDEA